MKRTLTKTTSVAAAVAVAMNSIATAQENTSPENQGTALMQAVAAYANATKELGTGLNTVYNGEITEMRKLQLIEPLEKRAFLLASGTADKELQGATGGRDEQIIERYQPASILDEEAVQLLCDPVMKAAKNKAPLAPLKTAGDRMLPASKPSEASGLALFAEAIGENPSIDANVPSPNTNVAEAAFKTCSDDLAKAVGYFEKLESEADGEALAEGLAILTAINTAKRALDGVFGALGRRISLARRDAALREFIQKMEPVPGYDKPSPSAMKISKKVVEDCEKDAADEVKELCDDNQIRKSISDISTQLKILSKEKREHHARAFYAAYIQHQWALDALKLETQTVNENGVEAKVFKLGSDTSLLGKTSSEKYALAKKYFEAEDVTTTREVLLTAASAYDDAFRTGSIAVSTNELTKAWSDLVKHAYEPKKFDLNKTIGLLTDIQAAVNGTEAAFNTLRTDLKAAVQKPDETEDNNDET